MNDKQQGQEDTSPITEIDWEAEAASGRCFVEVRDFDHQDWSYPKVLNGYRPCTPYPFWSEYTGWRRARIATVRGVWRSWYGGACPVPEDDDVSIMYRSGTRNLLRRAGSLIWEHTGADCDIVAFCWLP